MNFEYYNKVLALPLKSTMKGVLRLLAYHCNPKLANLCIPSWDTIQHESGVSRDVISDSLRIAKEAGIIDYRHRGDIQTGKKANEYFFKFEGIKFYKSSGKVRISKITRQEVKQKIENAKLKIKAEDKTNGKKSRSAFPDKSTYTTNSKNPNIRTHQKPQKSNTRLSRIQRLEGYAKSPVTRPINQDTRPEVIDTCEQTTTSNTTRETTSQPWNNKKAVLQGEQRSYVSNTVPAPKINPPLKKTLSEQTHNEWLECYENG